MKQRTLYAVGTPGGLWADWAAAQLSGTPFGEQLAASTTPAREAAPNMAALPVSPQGGIFAAGWQFAEQLAAELPEACFAVFIDNPARGLAAAIGAGGTTDVTGWLAQWITGGRALQKLAQQHRERCLVAELSEVALQPEAWRAAIQSQFGMALDGVGGDGALLAVDPLASALAEAITSGRPDVMALHRDLVASCCELTTIRQDRELLPQGRRFEFDAALARLSALQSAESEDASLRSRLAAALAAGIASETRHGETVRDLTEQLEEAKRVAQTQAAQTHALEVQIDQARTDASRLATERDAAREAADTTAAQLEAVSSQLRRCGDDAAAMLLQLHEAQDALEAAESRVRKLQSAQAVARAPAAAPAPPPASQRDDVDIAEALLGTARDETPHRELSVTLRNIRQEARAVPDAFVRLVEHHGNPGIAIFSRRVPLVNAWSETGREGDQPFMLLIPSDPHSHEQLRSMDSDDFALLLAVCERIGAEIRRRPAAFQGQWLALALRLAAQLRELPDILRFATASFEPVSDATERTLRVCLQRVLWRSRSLPSLTVDWQPAGTQAGLRLHLQPDGRVPLTSWPDDDTGDPVPVLSVAPGAGAPAVERQAWSRVTPQDRTFLLGLVARWPGIVASFPAGSVSAAELAAAHALLRRCGPALAPPPASRPDGLIGRVLWRLARQWQRVDAT